MTRLLTLLESWLAWMDKKFWGDIKTEDLAMKADIQLSKNKQGCWQWRITASNGEILCHSEAYASKQKCLQTAKRLAEVTGLSIVKP